MVKNLQLANEWQYGKYSFEAKTNYEIHRLLPQLHGLANNI